MVPLGLAAVLQIVSAAIVSQDPQFNTPLPFAFNYFEPGLLPWEFILRLDVSALFDWMVAFEFMKWLVFLIIAIWLTVAQAMSWRPKVAKADEGAILPA